MGAVEDKGTWEGEEERLTVRTEGPKKYVWRGPAAEGLPMGNHVYKYRNLCPFSPTLTFQVTAQPPRLGPGGCPASGVSIWDFIPSTTGKPLKSGSKGT